MESTNLSYLDLYSLLSERLGGVSTNVFNTIAGYIYTSAAIPNSLDMVDLSITTQTILLELDMRKFHHINMLKENTGVVQKMAQQLTDNQNQLHIRYLMHIKSKLFEINREGNVFNYQEMMFSELNCMNSSINFVFVRGGEVYNLLLFANGKLQIPGVRDLFAHSKHMFFTQCMFKVYIMLFGGTIRILHQQNVMCNFLCHLSLEPTYRVNLVSFTFGVSQKMDTFKQTCSQFGLALADISIGSKRNVMYIKFKIDKAPQVGEYNPNSTSNRRNFASVTFQVTQKGFVIIQGSAGQNASSFELIKRVQTLFKSILAPYVRQTPPITTKTAKPTKRPSRKRRGA